MSDIDKQQNQLEMADVCSTVISIPEQDRTEQSRTRQSLGEGGSYADGNSACLTRHLSVHAAGTDRDGHALNASDDKENLSPETVFIGLQDDEVAGREAIFTDSLKRRVKVRREALLKQAEVNDGCIAENLKNDVESDEHHGSIFKEQDKVSFSDDVGKRYVKLTSVSGRDTSKTGEDSKTDLSDDSPRATDIICPDSGGASSKDPTASRPGKLGMLPNTNNWKRVRNTLKAASEMQGPKKHKHTLDREDSFLRKFSTRNHQDIQNSPSSFDDEDQRSSSSSSSHEGRFVIQHDGTFMFYWLGVVTLAVLYNIWTCIARQAFIEIQQGCPPCWYTFDGLVDFIYICDILVQFRTGYLDQGLMVYDSRKLFIRYVRSKCIYTDFLCLLPLDLIQLVIGVHPMIRFPRFFKVYRTFRFIYMQESRTAYPNLFRVANLTHLVLLGAHWFAAFYYMISEAEKFQGTWSYPEPTGPFAEVTRKYLQCLHWAVLTLTTIGDLPIPENANQ